MVFRGVMAGASSAGSCMSSKTARKGKTPRPGTGHARRLASALSNGAGLGGFNKIFAERVEHNGSATRLMLDAAHRKAHRTAASLLKKRGFSRCIGRAKGGLNAKLHAVCHAFGRPTAFYPRSVTFFHQKIWHTDGTKSCAQRKRAYSFHRKPLKFLVELKRIELLAS